MTLDFEKVKALFHAAIDEHPPEDWDGFLDEACAGDADLRLEVSNLLHAHQSGGSLIDEPCLVPNADGALKQPEDLAGTLIGPYKLLELIGEGGFGIVFLAEQERPVRRKVALKIIKPGMDTRQVIARFEAERQALAMMDHPNIAKVLDAGTTGEVRNVEFGVRNEGESNAAPGIPHSPFPTPHSSARPYFVMELVQGVPITEYCDQCNLTTRDRLELFLTVCQAVQHAHQKGVIHRDLKPTNILVAMQDGRPAPKIIDFGVAKALNQRLTEHTLATGFAQMIGTPLYMSPEQAELSPLGADTRSDIYSLGVLLYELLTGTTPFDKERLHSVGYDDMRRILREEEPPRPSARINTLAADAVSTLAERRRTEPRRLAQSIRGELDWIVMKCLDKDRNRRYPTVGALLLDVQRYLNDEHVEACPPSVAYRFRKLVRRNRGMFAAGGLLAVTLTFGTALSMSQAMRATKAEALASARLIEATEARARAEIHENKARRAVDEMYTQVAEQWLTQQPQMEPIQREFLEKALKFYTGFAKERGNDPAVRLEAANAYRRIGEIQHRLAQPAPAEQAFQRAIGRMQSLADEFPAAAEYRADLAATLHKLGVLLGDTGRYHEEERAHRRALSLEEQLAAKEPNSARYRRDLGRAYWYLAEGFTSLHHRPDSELAYRSALAIQRPLAAEFPSVEEHRQYLAETLLGLGKVLRHIGRADEYVAIFDEAIALLEQLAQEFPNRPGYRNQLAYAYYWRARGRPPSTEHERFLRKALALQKRLADDFPAVVDYRYDLQRSHRTLGWILGVLKRPEEAEAAFREAASIAEKLSADFPSVHYYLGGLALTYHALGEFRAESGRLHDAEDAFRRSIAHFETLVAEFPAVPEYEPDLCQTYRHLGGVLAATGRPDEAAAEYRKALALDPDDELARRGLNELEAPTTATKDK